MSKLKRWTCVKCGDTHTGNTKGVLIGQGDKMCKACWQQQHPQPPKPLVTTWLEQCCISEPGYWTETRRLYASYKGWCKTIDSVHLNYNTFSSRLKKLNYQVNAVRQVPTTTTSKSRKAWGVEGLHLNAQGIQNLRLK